MSRDRFIVTSPQAVCDDLRWLLGRLIAATHQHTDGIPILLSLITGLVRSSATLAALMRPFANCHGGNAASHGQLIARGAWNLQRVNQCH